MGSCMRPMNMKYKKKIECTRHKISMITDVTLPLFELASSVTTVVNNVHILYGKGFFNASRGSSTIPDTDSPLYIMT